MTTYTKGTGIHQVKLQQIQLGNDILLILTGGEQPHIGATITKAPNQDIQMQKIGTHHDHIVLEPLTLKAAEKHPNNTIVATGGIHIDNATSKDIETIIQNCKELETCI